MNRAIRNLDKGALSWEVKKLNGITRRNSAVEEIFEIVQGAHKISLPVWRHLHLKPINGMIPNHIQIIESIKL